MTPIYDDDAHVRAREYERARYDSVKASFKYYRKTLQLTDDAIEKRIGDVWNDPVKMANACEFLKAEQLRKRRLGRTVRLLKREEAKLKAIDDAAERR